MFKRNIIFYEFNHFIRSKAKLYSFVFFFLACTYSIISGFNLYNKQIQTIDEVKVVEHKTIDKVTNWFKSETYGPEDRSWVDVRNPYWAIRYTPTHAYKAPSPLLPLGVGQSEQYGFYHKLSIWSSTMDSDVIEEISNFERLVNGNVDFSFLILYLLPLLLIILLYNIFGLEKDLKINNLILNQIGSYNKWIINRLIFYIFLVSSFVNILLLLVGVINQSIDSDLLKLVVLVNIYIFILFVTFYYIIKLSNSSFSIAFKMITVWLIFYVIVPGAAHQYSNLRYPTNYMTDFLDANREETYAIFKKSKEELYDDLINIYPDLKSSAHAKDSVISREIVRNGMSAIANHLNINAIEKIEIHNQKKNSLVEICYWFNPLSFFQNKWNSYTSTDYMSYKQYRDDIQQLIDNRLELLVNGTWNKEVLETESYNKYLEKLK